MIIVMVRLDGVLTMVALGIRPLLFLSITAMSGG